MWRAEGGQAFVETALVVGLLGLMALGLLAWLPVHRARSTAQSAAYVCAVFAAEATDPDRAVRQGRAAALAVVEADWSGAWGVRYRVSVAPGRPGEPAVCRVAYEAPGRFGYAGARGEVTMQARTERWKGRWIGNTGRR